MIPIGNSWLLRVEGVNLDRFVFDTRDLSTIRGGGLMLLEAARKRVPELLKRHAEGNVEEVSVGASIGLFRFLPAKGTTAENVRDLVADGLRKDSSFQHATFVVDVVAEPTDPDSFREASERLLAKNRWRQFQAATLAVPENVTPHDRKESVCEFDGVRPSFGSRDGAQKAASASVLMRRGHGREQKQQFYIEHSGLARPSLPHDFAYEFEDIAQAQSGLPLGNKVAVFYADGNRFSKIQRRLCETRERLKAWDGFLRKQRSAWLKQFLEEELTADGNDGWLVAVNDEGRSELRYRFETLLWGGDEVMFVLPAWMGWRFARHFFASVERWNANQIKDEHGNVLAADEPLTHTAALVFCHHHAPIHRIKSLAKEKMAEMAKEKSRVRNQLVCQALESFEHLGADYVTAVQRRVGRCCPDINELIISAPSNESLAAKLETIGSIVDSLHDSEFARSQLRTWVVDLIRGRRSLAGKEEHEKMIVRLAKGDAAIAKKLDELCTYFASPGAFWFHLEELWDYARP